MVKLQEMTRCTQQPQSPRRVGLLHRVRTHAPPLQAITAEHMTATDAAGGIDEPRQMIQAIAQEIACNYDTPAAGQQSNVASPPQQFHRMISNIPAFSGAPGQDFEDWQEHAESILTAHQAPTASWASPSHLSGRTRQGLLGTCTQTCPK